MDEYGEGVKPCPFCGKEHDLISADGACIARPTVMMITCTACRIVFLIEDKHRWRQVWNKRP